MRPFDRFTSIRAKLGAAIVIAIAVTIVVLYVLLAFTLPKSIVIYDGVRRSMWQDTALFVREAWWLLIVAGGMAAGVALLFVRVLARGMTKPLRQMAYAAGNMARGDYRERIDTDSRDEVGRLAGAFNQMAEKLEHVDRLRKDLVANVSHELKTPISAIRAHLENLLEGVEKPDPKTLEVMLRQSERLSALVEQVLDLSRLESGTMPIDPEPVSIRPIVEHVSQELAVGLGSRVRNDVARDLSPADADRQRIHQVLYNLLDNAVRYSPAGAEVRAGARQEGSMIVVEIEDSGPGIAQADLAHVFERFYRADPARARANGGTGGGAGLGLSIAKSIVEAHGGRIWAELTSPTGTRFSFTLPACRVPSSSGSADRAGNSRAAQTPSKEEA